MRIAIDVSPLTGGHLNRGIGIYTKNLIDALQTHVSIHTYLLFDSQKQKPPPSDIVHYPYFDPFFLTLPLFCPKPTVVTVHDLIPIVNPRHFPKGIRGAIKWEIQKFSLQRKQRIITDSEWSKKDITKIIHFDEKKIDVIYLAPSFQKNTIVKEESAVKRTYGIKGDYFLYVGDINWNKNIPGLLKAFSSIAIHYPAKYTLVLVGKAFLAMKTKEANDIDEFIKKLHLQNDVVRTGYVPNDHLATLYHNAVALIVPSLYEGFGFPVLEAMACECPVVCSVASSLKEIAGPSLMIDPHSVESLRSGMERMLSLTGEERKQLIQNGLNWVKQFTWKKVALQTVGSYEKALENI